MLPIFTSARTEGRFALPLPLTLSFPTGVAAALGLLSLMVVAPQTAHAQANLTFGGGSGSPLTLSLANPITYTIITPSGANAIAPLFLFKAVGGATFAGFVTGNITYNINGGSAQTLSFLNNGSNVGAVTAADLYTSGPSAAGVAAGDVVRFFSGTLTTTTNIAGARPASGSFTTFIVDGAGTRLSSDGVAGPAAGAPEPGSIVLALAGSGPLLMGLARRKRSHNKKTAQ